MCLFAGFVGDYHPEKNDENSKYVMNTHKQFLIKYNKNQVCVYLCLQVNMPFRSYVFNILVFTRWRYPSGASDCLEVYNTPM
jgi:hypothetical protein